MIKTRKIDGLPLYYFTKINGIEGWYTQREIDGIYDPPDIEGLKYREKLVSKFKLKDLNCN